MRRRIKIYEDEFTLLADAERKMKGKIINEATLLQISFYIDVVCVLLINIMFRKKEKKNVLIVLVAR